MLILVGLEHLQTYRPMSKKSEIIIAGKTLSFFNQEIRKSEELGDITVLIFQGDYPPLEKNYHNALAVNNSNGTVVWEIESDSKLDFQNPYEGVVDNGPYLIFFKAKGHRIAVNRHNGKILRNVDLMTGQRPW